MKPRRYKQWVVQYFSDRKWGQIPGDQFSSKTQAAQCYNFRLLRFTPKRWRIIERTIVVRAERICALEVGCWAFSIGGEHYYGNLKWYDLKGELQIEELKHPLTQREATELNKKRNTRNSPFKYKRGQLSENFWIEEQVRRTAISDYKRLTGCSILIVGQFGVCDPQEVLDGPADFREAVNELWRQRKACGGYEKSPNLCTAIFRTYQRLLEKWGVK